METETRIEDSPFYVEYHEKMEDKSFKMETDMLNALKKHFKDKYDDDVRKNEHGKFKFGKYLRITLGNYLQEQCLERKIFNKSIFALVNIDSVKKRYEDAITTLFVANPSEYYTRHDYVGSVPYNFAPRESIKDFKDGKFKQWDEELQSIFNDKLKQHQESTDVLEIMLNNYLDVYHDGIYSNESDSSIHDGVNIIATDSGAFGVIYQWKVNDDYSMEIIAIQVCEQKKIMDLLYQCKNEKMYRWYSDILKAHNKHFELEMLVEQLEHVEQEEIAIHNKKLAIQKKINQLEKQDNH